MTEARTGSRRVTAADIARSLGISRATVGFVLNDTPGQTISPATRQRVLDEAQRLGYRPHAAARRLASGRSRIVLMLLPEWPLDHSMRAHIDEASLELDRAGYSLVTTAPHPGGQATPLWESLAPDVVVSLAPVPEAEYAAIRATGAETIVAGLDDPGPGAELRYADGPRLQVEHLVGRGCTRPAFAASPDPRIRSLVEQRRALADATAAERLGRGLEAVAEVAPDTAGAVVAKWAAAGIDGVVAYNDDVAALVLGAAVRQGIAVPERLAIVGHDDAPLAALLVPALSSVRVDSAGLGRFLARLALARLGQGEQPEPPPVELELVVRETS